MKKYLLIFTTFFISLSCIHADDHEDINWYPRIRFPESLYNQKDPQPFDNFVAALHEKNLTVQDEVKKQLKNQREIAEKRLQTKNISQEHFAKTVDAKKRFEDQENEKNEPLAIVWEKENVSEQDKELIETMIQQQCLKGTIYIQDLPETLENKNTHATSGKEFSITIWRRFIEFDNFKTVEKKKSIIRIPDHLLQKSQEFKKSVIAHELMHLRLNHSLELSLLQSVEPFHFPMFGPDKFIDLKRQIELEADTMATIETTENARCMCSLNEAYQGPIPKL